MKKWIVLIIIALIAITFFSLFKNRICMAKTETNNIPLQGPLYAFAWSSPQPKNASNIIPMLWVDNPVTSNSIAKLARQSRKLPDGKAVMFIFNFENLYYHGLLSNPKDFCRTVNGKLTNYPSPWLKYGTDTLKQAAIKFFRQYKNDGGKLNYLILDFENGLSNWQLNDVQIRAIQNDPRSKKLAKELGFTDFTSIEQFAQNNNYLKWNAVMGKIVAHALNASLFYAARRYFPGVKGSNYGYSIMTPQNALWAPDLNGHPQYSYSYVGTYGSDVFYPNIGALALYKLTGTTKTYVGNSSESYGRSSFAVLRWEINTMRAEKRSSNVPALPWIASPYNGLNPQFNKSPYYNELIYHLALCGASNFLLFNPHPWLKSQNPKHWATDADDLRLNNILYKINKKFDNYIRKPVTLAPIPWNSKIMVSGMQIGNNKILWRITVAPTVKTVHIIINKTSKTIHLKPGQVGFWYYTRPNQNVFINYKNLKITL